MTNKTANTEYSYTFMDASTAPYVSASAAQIPVEHMISYHDLGNSSTPLMTITKSWQTIFDLASTVTQYASLPSTQVVNTYGYFNGILSQLIEQDEYDFGQTAASRKTSWVYQAFTGTPASEVIFNEPCQKIISDTNSIRVAETDWYYDGNTSLCGSPTAQALAPVNNLAGGTHDEASFGANSLMPRGNPTQLTSWNSSGTSPTSTYTYDKTGQVLSITDPCGNASCSTMSGLSHTTQYSYVDNFSDGTVSGGNTNTYLTQVSLPAVQGRSQVRNSSYRFVDGQLSSSTDQNGGITTYSYDDPLARITKVQGPADSNNNNQRPTKTIAYNDSAPSPNVTTTEILNVSGALKTVVSGMDGIGHVTSLSASDPIGTDEVDTEYDGMGRVAMVSNPYRSPDLAVFTTFAYDALGRKTAQLDSDGVSVQQWCYNNAFRTVTLLPQRESCEWFLD